MNIRKRLERIAEAIDPSKGDKTGLVIVGCDGARCGDDMLTPTTGESNEGFFARLKRSWPHAAVVVPTKDLRAVKGSTSW